MGRIMRQLFVLTFVLMALALGVCALTARRSPKTIGSSVGLLLVSLIPPVLGNLIIIASGNWLLSNIGCYIYFLGMDFVMISLMWFTAKYCGINPNLRWLRVTASILLALDALQLLLNPLLGHAFRTEAIVLDGYAYFRLIPLAGQMFHRAAVYLVFFGVLVTFMVKAVRTPRIYAERYWVILLAMVFTGIWESFYIFSRTPIDQSMFGFGFFGILVFYFALYYRPVRLLDRMLAGIASGMREALFFFDASGRCIWANKPGKELTGIGETEVFDQVIPLLKERFGELGEGHDEWSLQYVSGQKENAEFYVLEKHTVKDDRNHKVGSFLSIRNNTDEQRELRRERYNATHDRLTGLYTKEYLYERIPFLLRKHSDQQFFVLFVNISNFKLVNDIFGNDFGDKALQQVAEWLDRILPPHCIFGRLTGDTFGACLPVEDFDPESIEDSLSEFVVTDGRVEHQILIHMGVYEVAETDMEVSLMFDRAHMALSTIRDTYQTHIAYYDEEMRERVLWNQKISTQLMEAIEERQIRPYLQPIVDADGKVIGAEALVRWIHPEKGNMPPALFIPVFEKNGMIAELDRYMWNSVCEILARWKREGRDWFISINVSPKDFYFMDVAEEIRSAVRRYGVEPRRLRIEITETVMMTDIENRVKILEELQADGFIVEMDDFGSGYSSLNLLKDIPVDLIKIDMMFLTESKDDGRAQTILDNIIHLSDHLGITTLTEGVETYAQYVMLVQMGCRFFQGYYFAKPMPVSEFESFCKTGRKAR